MTLVKYDYEKTRAAQQALDLHTYETHGLISSDTALLVSVIGVDGRVLMSTQRASRDVNLSDREHFRVHRDNPNVGLFISRPVVGRISHRWSVQGTRRIDNADGSFGGVVVVSEDPAHLTDDSYSQPALGTDGMIAVLSKQGFVLSRSARDERNPIGASLPQAYDALVRTGEATFVDPFDRVERVVATSAINQYGLLAVAGISVDEALADYYRMRDIYVTMAIVISVMLMGFVAWIMALIAQLLASREALQQLAHTDRLTGLWNRGRISDLVTSAVAAAAHAEKKVAVIFADLDNLKPLNDTHGHEAGDAALVALASHLRAAASEHGQVGRVGGDEFLVLVEAAHTDAARLAVDLVRRTVRSLEKPIMVKGELYRLGASFGVAVLQPGETAGELVRRADAAMYRGKKGLGIEVDDGFLGTGLCTSDDETRYCQRGAGHGSAAPTREVLAPCSRAVGLGQLTGES